MSSTQELISMTRELLEDAGAYGPADEFPHFIGVPFPTAPWDDECWVAKRDGMVAEHMKWLTDNGNVAAVDFRIWFNKPDAIVYYYFIDPKRAVMFKLACGGPQ
jgi:hypothetical protein